MPRLCFSVPHTKITLCSLAVWIRSALPLPSLPPETNHLFQKNHRLKHPELPLQEWQSETILNVHTVFNSISMLCLLFMFLLCSQPLMDCAVCYKTANDQIEPKPLPYVHCIQKPRLTKVSSFPSCYVYYYTCNISAFTVPPSYQWLICLALFTH